MSGSGLSNWKKVLRKIQRLQLVGGEIVSQKKEGEVSVAHKWDKVCRKLL